MQKTNFKHQKALLMDNINNTIDELRQRLAETNVEMDKLNQERQDSQAKIKELVAASNTATADDAPKNIISLSEPASQPKQADDISRIDDPHEACKRTIAHQEQTIKDQAERIRHLEFYTGTLAKENKICFQKYEDARFNHDEEKKKNDAMVDEIARLVKTL